MGIKKSDVKKNALSFQLIFFLCVIGMYILFLKKHHVKVHIHL